MLSGCDVLILLEVYPAGEEEIPGADSRALCRSIRQRGLVEPIYVKDIETVGDVLKDLLRDGDLVMTQGAGSVGKLVKLLDDRQLVQ